MRRNVISYTSQGDFSETHNFLKALAQKQFLKNLEVYGARGVAALSTATPRKTGKTAASWDYVIERTEDKVTITWINTNVVKDYANVALLLQYGHGTRNGGYVEGIDFINPALKPVFEEIARDAWREVISK